jgi:toxin ParE1/3/4
MANLRISAEARKDLQDINRYIARDKPNAARKWIQRIRAKCRLLARNPELGDPQEELGPNVRSSYLGDYIIFFRRMGNNVDILRIIRGHRDIRFL